MTLQLKYFFEEKKNLFQMIKMLYHGNFEQETIVNTPSLLSPIIPLKPTYLSEPCF
jgi:hypothetical protein